MFRATINPPWVTISDRVSMVWTGPKYTDKVQHSFYPQNQKTAWNGTNHYWVCTIWFALNELERERTSLVSVVRTGRLSDSVRNMETQWIKTLQ